MKQTPQIKIHIKCPNCSGKIMEGQRYRQSIELSCLICGWRVEPFIEKWEQDKQKIYKRIADERTRQDK
jgi:DNA-directed RNA polymerase subunit RPC12/RpoP